MKRRVRDFCSLAERLWPFIEVVRVVTPEDVDACWNWQGGGTSNNPALPYGRLMNERGRHEYAHRAMWRLIAGCDVAKGMLICHTCDNRLCCRPTHLFLGTHRDNMQDCRQKGRTHRPIGELSGRAKVTEDQVRAIRASSATVAQLAAEYGVTKMNIYHIRSRQSWAHL
jgi:hypothetical protein